MTNCPCGSGLALTACCGPYMDGAPAPTAEALMRSRYVAFTLGNGEYVRDTLTEEQKAEFDLEGFNASVPDTKWMGLEIRKTDKGGADDDTGTVEFIARYKDGGEQVLHHELAYFTRTDGHWLFADCIMSPKGAPVTVTKVGRNDPCPCGSGKKYKKCCGA